MGTDRQRLIRTLFEDYIEMYAGRDDGLTARFSANFSGYTGGGDFLVNDRERWVQITRQDFSEVPVRLDIEMLDLSLQDIAADVVIASAFFHIHLPIPDWFLSRETARLVLVFRFEGEDWKIVHSGISIPYRLVRDGEIFPLEGLRERNRELEFLVKERTRALEEANNKLEALSNTDGLTGIANRRWFDHVLEQEWNRAWRAGKPLALILIDVDHFKHFNDCYGHLAGDGCLRELARALTRGERRAGRLVARYGGEEFVVLLPDTWGHEALETARHIRHEARALALPHAETAQGIVTISLGVASLRPSRDYVSEDLVRQADLALYRAKNAGRDCAHLAEDPSLPSE